MAAPKKNTKKATVKVPDLRPAKNPKGGRDASTGLPTGKRMHKPYTVT